MYVCMYIYICFSSTAQIDCAGQEYCGPPPAMLAYAGYGEAVHNGKCAMHKLGIHVLSFFSPNMMTIIGCKVAMLSTGSHTTQQMTLRLASRSRWLFCCAASSRTEARHARPSGPPKGNLAAHARCDRICGLEGHAVQGGLNIGLEDTLAQFTIEECATGFKKSLAREPHGIKQSRGSSGEGIWITKRQPGSPCTVGSVDGLEGQALQGGHVEHRFGGHARTLHRSGWLQKKAGFPAPAA